MRILAGDQFEWHTPFFFEYHEMERAKTDRVKMNRRLFEILKPGGILVITDHAARTVDGIAQGAILHRI